MITLASVQKNRKLQLGLLALCILVGLGIYLALRPAASAKRPTAAPLPVRVATIQAQSVPEYLNGLGTVIPSQSSLVRSRVDGTLLRLHFEDGQIVKEGDLLAEIDPRPFEMALNDAKGQLARDKAILDNARLDLKRYVDLRDKDYVSAQQLATQNSTVRQYEGIVASDKAKVDDAALNLEYSRITAPMSGRLGLRQVDAGNMIRASDTAGIVRITQMEPAYVFFTLPESQLPLILESLRAAEASNSPLKVDVWDREFKKQLTTGFLLTLDNQIDTGTGTIKLKAQFPNTDGQLFPNQFVNAQLLVRTLHNALVAPTSAIQRGSKGTFVYVVKNNTTEVRPVVTGWVSNNTTVIQSGLSAGEEVVTDGLDRLRNGMAVTIVRDSDSDAPPVTKAAGTPPAAAGATAKPSTNAPATVSTPAPSPAR